MTALEKLREEIAREIAVWFEAQDGCFGRSHGVEDAQTGIVTTKGWPLFDGAVNVPALAERILAIPSIATALRFTDLHRQAGNVVGDPKLGTR